MAIKQLEFEGSLGDTLAGLVELPVETPRAWALFAHCFTCSKDLKAAYWISKALVDRGVAVMRFDFTGLGQSRGEFSETNFTSNLADLIAAAGALREHFHAPQILIGHSLGGAAALAAAERIPECRAVATIAAPSDTADLAQTLTRQAPDLLERGETEIRIGGKTLRLKRQLIEDLSRGHVEEAVSQIRRAVLLLHAPGDAVVSIEHARKIFEAAAHPKSFVSLDDADHLLSRERDARYAADVIASWATRYLDPPAEQVESEDELDQNEVLASGPLVGFATRIRAGRHVLRADEPPAIGGSDSGPTPYGLLMAALGACTNMTIRMYARRKNWPLENVDVRLRHEKIHAKDCEHCETKDGKLDRIEKIIELDGPLDESQRARLREIGERCPVNRTLLSEIDIVARER
jgi:putative redox protein